MIEGIDGQDTEDDRAAGVEIDLRDAGCSAASDVVEMGGVTTNDSAEAEIVPGEAYEIQPGHDGWVIGDEAVMSVEFAGGGPKPRTADRIPATLPA